LCIFFGRFSQTQEEHLHPMRVKIAARHMDAIMMANAAMIAVASMVVFAVVLTLNWEPMRQSRDMALTLIGATSDIATGDSLSGIRLDMDGVGTMLSRLSLARQQIGELKEGASVDIFSDHPLFRPVSAEPEAMRFLALAQARAGSLLFSRTESIDGTTYLRIFAPVAAPSDCISCASSGMPQFSRGDIIAVREVRYPVTPSWSGTALLLAAALMLLVAALAIFTLIVIPLIRRNRQEKAQIHNLAATL
jgi:hypothetical protein